MLPKQMFLRAALAACAALSLHAAERPAITGISHMCLYAADLPASDHFYSGILGAHKGPDPLNPQGVLYHFSPTQFIEVLPLPAAQGISRMACVAYNTTDASALRQYLQTQGVTAVGDLHTATDLQWFETKDPEGNLVRFVQPGKQAAPASDAHSVSMRIIHVGYLVHSRSAEDHFYKDILGFRPYWFGAMHPGHTDWFSLQTPDAHDWLEYMLVGEGSDVPEAKVDAHELGILNHFSLGVRNMEEAVTTLYKEDRLPPRHDGPQMGKDGKWQANLYDPDGTRVELMEFQPVMAPCCSPFTADSPSN